MINTKARHQEILAAAAEALERVGGVEIIDALPQEDRAQRFRELALDVRNVTDCTLVAARHNIIRALHRSRHPLNDIDQWGGARPNPGPAPLPEGERRQKASPKLAPGSKELAQAIAKVKGLPGWGHAVDVALVKMVYADEELRMKLAKMGIIIKGNDGKGLDDVQEIR